MTVRDTPDSKAGGSGIPGGRAPRVSRVGFSGSTTSMPQMPRTAQSKISNNINDIRSALAARAQQHKMDAARSSGQMTNLEWKRRNNILMARRRRAGL